MLSINYDGQHLQLHPDSSYFTWALSLADRRQDRDCAGHGSWRGKLRDADSSAPIVQSQSLRQKLRELEDTWQQVL